MSYSLPLSDSKHCRNIVAVYLTPYGCQFCHCNVYLLKEWRYFGNQTDVLERVKFKLVSMVHSCLHHKAPRYLMDYCIPISGIRMWPVDGIFVLSGVITSLCLDTVSACMGSARHLLLSAQLPGTHWVMICVIWHLALTVSDVCLKLCCFHSTTLCPQKTWLHFLQ